MSFSSNLAHSSASLALAPSALLACGVKDEAAAAAVDEDAADAHCDALKRCAARRPAENESDGAASAGRRIGADDDDDAEEAGAYDASGSWAPVLLLLLWLGRSKRCRILATGI